MKVVLHLNVKGVNAVARTKKWFIEAHGEPTGTQMSFKLTPAPKHAKVDILGLSVKESTVPGMAAQICFDSHEEIHAKGVAKKKSPSLFGMSRRVRLAQLHAQAASA